MKTLISIAQQEEKRILRLQQQEFEIRQQEIEIRNLRLENRGLELLNNDLESQLERIRSRLRVLNLNPYDNPEDDASDYR